MTLTNTSLNVQIRSIEGDLAELFFNPREADLHVGETLTLREREMRGEPFLLEVAPWASSTS